MAFTGSTGETNFVKHNIMNAEEKHNQCQDCDKCFSHKCNLTSHLKTNSEENTYQCQQCKKYFTHIDKLVIHQLLHTGEKPYKCKHCGMAFSSSDVLKFHMRTHIDETPYQCNQCDKAYSQNDQLIIHMGGHTLGKGYSCSLCNTEFTHEAKLLIHQSLHTGKRPYQCSNCDKAFSSRSVLKCHMRRHSGEAPYKCNQCDKGFAQKCNLVSHLRTHTVEKTYQCSYCDKVFLHSIHLIMHLRIHTGEKPYKCSQCDKAYSQNIQLEIHMRTHTAEKTYQCSHCDKAFPNNSDLIRHMRTHTGENSDYIIEHEEINEPYTYLDLGLENKNVETSFETEQNYITIPEDQVSINVDQELDDDILGITTPVKQLLYNDVEVKVVNVIGTIQSVKQDIYGNDVEQCEQEFDDDIHDITTHTGEKTYPCSHCDKAFPTNSDLIRHMRTHTSEKSDYIIEHEEINEHYTYLDLGLENKNVETSFKTEQNDITIPEDQVSIKVDQELDDDILGITSPVKQVLYNDVEVNVVNVIGTIQSVKQDIAGNDVVQGEQELDDMLDITAHTDEKTYPCSQCDKAFPTNSDLIRHMRTHTGEKSDSIIEHEEINEPYTYLNLGLENKNVETSFKTEQNDITIPEDQDSIKVEQELGDDILGITTPVKQVLYSDGEVKVVNVIGNIQSVKQEIDGNDVEQCEQELDDDIRDITTHTGEKTYQCSHCDKAFPTNCDLIRHMRTHTGEKSDSIIEHEEFNEPYTYLDLGLENKNVETSFNTELSDITIPEDQVSLKVEQELDDDILDITAPNYHWEIE